MKEENKYLFIFIILKVKKLNAAVSSSNEICIQIVYFAGKGEEREI
jgi:hypothetical protein